MTHTATKPEGPSSMDKIKGWFGGAERGENAHYDRRLLDGRIEKYLDKNFNTYVTEFGMVRSLDLRVYDERVDVLIPRVDQLLIFSKDTEAHVSELEGRVLEIKKMSKKKGGAQK